MGWYCGAGVFGLIGCRSLSLNLALPTSFNNNNYIFIPITHVYNHYDVFITNWTVTVNRHWYSDTNVYFRAQSLYCIYESFQGKIILAENDRIFIVVNFYYCYQVYNNRRRYRRLPVMADGQLTANIRR